MGLRQAGYTLGCNGGQAFQRLVPPGAMRLHARDAIQTGANGTVELTVRAGASGFRGAENGNERFAESSCDVHGPGVIRDHQGRGADPLNHFRQRQFAREIHAAIRGSLGNSGGEW